MSTNIYMEPSNYASTHYGGGPLPDRQPAFFQGDASHEPRAARPFDSHGSSAGPSDLYAQQPPAPGVLDNHHSPLSSGLPFAEQNAAHPGMSYRPHSPGSSSITSSPGYRGSFSHHQIPGMAHQRHDSISSLSSPHDVGGPWAPSSPALGGGPPSRHASIYSLNGHFDQVGINNTPSLDGSSSQHTTGTTSGHMYEQSPPLPAQIRYAQAAQAIDARRFSLDERQIRSQPQAMKGSSGDLQTSSGRHWPWGTGASGIHGRHASVSAAPQQSSYEYSQQTRTPYGHTAASGFHSYDPSQASPLSPQRYRSMSSSAISGRQYPYPYGSPGTAAHAAAAMGYGMAPHMGPGGMLMDGEIPEGPGPARRAKFKRSRTGCLVCRKRKVKCSQDGTPCKQCRIGKRDCHYEDQPQKKKTKKDKAAAAAAAATTTSAGAPASSSNGAPADGSEKNSSNGASQGGSAASGSGGMASQGSYYAHSQHDVLGHESGNNWAKRYSDADHRSSALTSHHMNGAHSSASHGGVTFSMPFSNQATPSVAPSHSASSDGAWSTSSPFNSGPGPHGELHPSHHNEHLAPQEHGADSTEYGWTPTKHAADNDARGAYPAPPPAAVGLGQPDLRDGHGHGSYWSGPNPQHTYAPPPPSGFEMKHEVGGDHPAAHHH